MITEDYVSFETAKHLKVNGFDWDCQYCYIDEDDSDKEQLEVPTGYDAEIDAPTLQMAMKWLREVHKLCISVTPQVTDDDGDGGCLWQFAITSHLEPLNISLELYEQYEEVCEAAIKYCLENLI